MKVFRVYFHDRWETFGYQDFTNREAAEAYVKWHTSHPIPEDEMGWYDISEININLPQDTFVPPMTDEEYHRKYDDYLCSRDSDNY